MTPSRPVIIVGGSACGYLRTGGVVFTSARHTMTSSNINVAHALNRMGHSTGCIHDPVGLAQTHIVDFSLNVVVKDAPVLPGLRYMQRVM